MYSYIINYTHVHNVMYSTWI